jgi:hypothetical protein
LAGALGSDSAEALAALNASASAASALAAPEPGSVGNFMRRD